MEPTRWYYLRHPNGFDDRMFDLFVSSCRYWESLVRVQLDNWHLFFPDSTQPAPIYEFGAPARADMAHCVVLPIGGQATYGSLHLLEEVFPAELHSFIPLAFKMDLEIGRRDTLGWFPEIFWSRPVYREPRGLRGLLLRMARWSVGVLDPRIWTNRRFARQLSAMRRKGLNARGHS